MAATRGRLNSAVRLRSTTSDPAVGVVRAEQYLEARTVIKAEFQEGSRSHRVGKFTPGGEYEVAVGLRLALPTHHRHCSWYQLIPETWLAGKPQKYPDVLLVPYREITQHSVRLQRPIHQWGSLVVLLSTPGPAKTALVALPTAKSPKQRYYLSAGRLCALSGSMGSL